MCTGILPAGVFIYPYACAVRRGQNKVSFPLELELQMLVSCSPGTGTQTPRSSESKKCSLLSHLSSPSRFFFLATTD